MKVHVAVIDYGGEQEIRVFAKRKKALKWAARRHLKLRYRGWVLIGTKVRTKKVR